MEYLETKSLTKTFGGIKAVDNLSLVFERQKIVALIGPNGAGKTTLFNICTGFLPPDEGQVLFKGQNLIGTPPHKLTWSGIARTFQDLRLIHNLTLLENILLSMPDNSGNSLAKAIWCPNADQNIVKAQDWLNFVGLQGKAKEHAGALSYGQQKLLSLLCCIATDAELLLLDEPIAGVEPAMAEKILAFIQNLPRLDKTVIFIEHNLLAVKSIAERVIVMDEGKKIADGTWEMISGSSSVVEAYLA